METDRLLGAPIAEDDVPFLLGVWNDERVAPTIGGPRTEEQIRERLGRWTRHWDTHGFGGLTFRERTSGGRIGWGGLQPSDDVGLAYVTVGYVIAPEAWGNGYATEIATAAIRYGFDEVGLERIFASVLATNSPSRRVLEKAGLVVDREIDHGGHVEVVYSVGR